MRPAFHPLSLLVDVLFDEKKAEKQEEQLHQKIGQLTIEVDWLKKKCKQLNIPLDDAR